MAIFYIKFTLYKYERKQNPKRFNLPPERIRETINHEEITYYFLHTSFTFILSLHTSRNAKKFHSRLNPKRLSFFLGKIKAANPETTQNSAE